MILRLRGILAADCTNSDFSAPSVNRYCIVPLSLQLALAQWLTLSLDSLLAHDTRRVVLLLQFHWQRWCNKRAVTSELLIRNPYLWVDKVICRYLKPASCVIGKVSYVQPSVMMSSVGLTVLVRRRRNCPCRDDGAKVVTLWAASSHAVYRWWLSPHDSNECLQYKHQHLELATVNKWWSLAWSSDHKHHQQRERGNISVSSVDYMATQWYHWRQL